MLSIMINNQPYICHLSNVMIESKWKITFKKLNIENSTNLSLNPKLSKIAYSTQDGTVYLCSLYNQSFNLNFSSSENANLNNEKQIQIFEGGSEVVHLFWLNNFTQLCSIKRGGELYLWNCEDNSSFKTIIRDLADVDSLEFDSLTKTLLCINGKCLINISFCTLDPPLCLTSSSIFSILNGKMVASIHKKSHSQFDSILSLPPEIFPIRKAAESPESDMAIYGGDCLVVITENKLFLTKISDMTEMCWCNQKLYVFSTALKKSRLSSSKLSIFSRELVKIGSVSSPHIAEMVAASPENNRVVICNRHFLTVFDFDPSNSIKKPPQAKFQESHIGWEEFSMTVTTFTIIEPILNVVCGLENELWLHLKTKTSAGNFTESYNFDYINTIKSGSENETNQTLKKFNENKQTNKIDNNQNTNNQNINTNNVNNIDNNINIANNKNTNNQNINNTNNISISTSNSNIIYKNSNIENNKNFNTTNNSIEATNNLNNNAENKNIKKGQSNNHTNNNIADDDYDNIVVSFPSFNVIETNVDKMWNQPRLNLLFLEKMNTIKIYSTYESTLYSFSVTYKRSIDSNITSNEIERKSDSPLCSFRSDFIFLNTSLTFGTFPFTTIDFAFRIMKEELSNDTTRCFVFTRSLINLDDFNHIMSQLCVYSLQNGKIGEYLQLMKMFEPKEALAILSSFDKSILAVLATTFSIDEDFFEISEIYSSLDNESQIQILTTASPSEFLKIIKNIHLKKLEIHFLSKIVDSLILSMEWSKLERFCNALLNEQIKIDLPSKLMSFKELGDLQFGQTLKIIEKDVLKWKDVKIQNSTFSIDQSNQNELLKNLAFAFIAADFGQWAAACFSVNGDKNKCKFILLDKPEIISDVEKFINDIDNLHQEQIISFLRDIINEIQKIDI